MSDRRDLFGELESLIERLDDAAVGLDAPFAPARTPPVDVLDAGGAVEVRADLPGVAREDVDLRLAGGTLHLAADAPVDAPEDATYVTQERTRNRLDRAVDLPVPVEAEAVTASLTDGVLTVTLPKVSPTDEGTEIDIE